MAALPPSLRTGRARRSAALALAAICLVTTHALIGVMPALAAASSTPQQRQSAAEELTAGKAVVLGLVEGITEFLPISSTGHLLVSEHLVNVGQDQATKDAADTYTIAIQFGAILAVVVLYFARLRAMAEGLVGRDPAGRRTLIALVIAFIPAAVVGVVGEHFIKAHLLSVWPVVAAWIVGAIVLFATAHRFNEHSGGSALEQITIRQALIIGVVQCVAMWPGTSRSLVTILAALFVGLSLGAAVEFSFLLGLVTLSAATFYDLAKHGGELLDTFGWVNPLIGLVVAFLSAVVAIRWMVTYLQRHDLRIFAWYRLAIAALTIVLVAAGTIHP